MVVDLGEVLGLVGGDDDVGGLGELLHDLAERPPLGGVETGGGFVHQHQPRSAPASRATPTRRN